MVQCSDHFFQELPHSCRIVMEQEKIALLPHCQLNPLNSFHEPIHDTVIVSSINCDSTVCKFFVNYPFALETIFLEFWQICSHPLGTSAFCFWIIDKTPAFIICYYFFVKIQMDFEHFEQVHARSNTLVSLFFYKTTLILQFVSLFFYFLVDHARYRTLKFFHKMLYTVCVIRFEELCCKCFFSSFVQICCIVLFNNKNTFVLGKKPLSPSLHTLPLTVC